MPDRLICVLCAISWPHRNKIKYICSALRSHRGRPDADRRNTVRPGGFHRADRGSGNFDIIFGPFWTILDHFLTQFAALCHPTRAVRWALHQGSLDAHRHLQSDVIPDSPGCRAHDAAGRDRAAHGAALQHRRPAPLHPARLEITDFYFWGICRQSTLPPLSRKAIPPRSLCKAVVTQSVAPRRPRTPV